MPGPAPFLVSLTGADESVNPYDLYALAEEFPEIEWAILSMATKVSVPRYPGDSWVARFIAQAPDDMKRAIHLCGTDVDGFLRQDARIVDKISGFQRIQLNFNQLRSQKSLENLAAAIAAAAQDVIVQQHAGNVGVLDALVGYGGKQPLVLFDGSGGHGALPRAGLPPPNGGLCGYAGGLGPDNISIELPKIQLAAGGAPYYIDMESSLRSMTPTGEDVFDLGKCRRVLELARATVVPEVHKMRP